jgi:hypothetical protein
VNNHQFWLFTFFVPIPTAGGNAFRQPVDFFNYFFIHVNCFYYEQKKSRSESSRVGYARACSGRWWSAKAYEMPTVTAAAMRHASFVAAGAESQHFGHGAQQRR